MSTDAHADNVTRVGGWRRILQLPSADGFHHGSFLRPLLVMTFVATVAAQTQITPPKNKYSPDDDVKVGRAAAAQVRREQCTCALEATAVESSSLLPMSPEWTVTYVFGIPVSG